MPRAARITKDGLTLKEEKFCQEYFSSTDGLSSYVKVYSPGADRQEQWLREEVYRLLQKPHIRKRIEDLRATAETIASYTADHAMREAGEAFALAKKLKLPQAMTGAVTLRAKLAGHLVEKREVSTRSVRDYTKEELEEEIQRAAREAGLVIQKAQESSK